MSIRIVRNNAPIICWDGMKRKESIRASWLESAQDRCFKDFAWVWMIARGRGLGLLDEDEQPSSTGSRIPREVNPMVTITRIKNMHVLLYAVRDTNSPVAGWNTVR
jgi:hypothetical protein